MEHNKAFGKTASSPRSHREMRSVAYAAYIAYRVDLVRLRQRGNSQRYLNPAPV